VLIILVLLLIDKSFEEPQIWIYYYVILRFNPTPLKMSDSWGSRRSQIFRYTILESPSSSRSTMVLWTQLLFNRRLPGISIISIG